MSEGRSFSLSNRPGVLGLLLLSAIVVVVIALMFGIAAELRWIAPLMALLLLLCVAQMLRNQIPQKVAIVLGGILFPFAAAINPVFVGRFRLQPIVLMDWLWLIVCGLIVGYLSGRLLTGIFAVSDQLRSGCREETYSVPKRFGMGTILMATTLFAILFAVLKWAKASPAELFFFTAFVGTVSVSQMVFDRSPRWASVFCGAIYLPLSVMLSDVVPGRSIVRIFNDYDWWLIAIYGLLVGYLGGAIMAGIFLISDYLARWWASTSSPLPSA